MKRLLGMFAVLVLAGCAATGSYRDTGVGMTSMAVFDPVRYSGLWYEVARFPVPFQAGCSDTRATYGLQPDGSFSVRNDCVKNGVPTSITGTARIAGPGRLKVRLGGMPVAADYWILWVDEGYRTAVVGVPSGRAGWILNRDPEIPPDRMHAAREVLKFNGYDTSQLVIAPAGSEQ